MRRFLTLCLVFFSSLALAEEDNVINVYVWSQELSEKIVDQFQNETGIKVNYSTFDSNEVLYAKMKASQNSLYDLIEPSGYYVTRMAREGMIEKIDFSKLSNFKNINERFLHSDYDPSGSYSVPWVWGATGIFINRQYYPKAVIKNWSDLWSKRYRDSLLMLDDPREAFNIGLLTLKFSPNTEDLHQLNQAYQNLVQLLPNVRVYNSSSVPAMLTDEDVTIGMAWNGDVFKATMENPTLEFIYPNDGFVMWVDAFAIPKDAPHRKNAYLFLNYILQAKIAALQVKESYYATANKAAIAFLPKELAESKLIFLDDDTMRRGYFQTDLNNDALEAISRYWQLLKLQ